MKKLNTLYSSSSKHSCYQEIHPSLTKNIEVTANVAIQRYELQRAKFISDNLNFQDKMVLDIGGNTGYFSFEAISKGAKSVLLIEGNENHAEFVSELAIAENLPISVSNKYFDFENNNSKSDIVFILNVLHHIGDDFGSQNISKSEALNYIAKAINNFHEKTDILIFQLGYNWKGDRNLPLFENGTKREMIEFVYNTIKHNWDLIHVGIAEVVNGETIFNYLNQENIERDDELGEFRNRPLFILRKKTIESDPDKEISFLDSLVETYKDDSPYSRIKKDIILSEMRDHIDRKDIVNVLQLGCSNGYETDELIKTFGKLDVVDGSTVFINKMNEKNTNMNVNFIHSLFENLNKTLKGRKYDLIVCNYVLEHVTDPIFVLQQLKSLLKNSGQIVVVVPNAHALSRQIAVQMNLLSSLTALSENDIAHGHRRVYTKDNIEKDLLVSGLKILSRKGVIFKILADFQLNKLIAEGTLTNNHFSALQKITNQNENIPFSDSFLYFLGK